MSGGQLFQLGISQINLLLQLGDLLLEVLFFDYTDRARLELHLALLLEYGGAAGEVVLVVLVLVSRLRLVAVKRRGLSVRRSVSSRGIELTSPRRLAPIPQALGLFVYHLGVCGANLLIAGERVELGGRPLGNLLRHLLKRSLLGLELYLKLRDVLLLVDSPLKQFHSSEKLVDLRAEIFLLGQEILELLGVEYSTGDVHRGALTSRVDDVGTWPGSLDLFLLILDLAVVGLHLEPIVVDP